MLVCVRAVSERERAPASVCVRNGDSHGWLHVIRISSAEPENMREIIETVLCAHCSA